MIAGTVNALGIPTVSLEVAGRSWLATVDTGFNGDLELPEELKPLLNARWKGQVLSLLAAGQTVVEDVWLVDFPFDGQIVEAEATFALGADVLVGTHLLRQYRLVVDFPAKSVLLERGAGS